jgi:nucleoside-diphosphate-sugar epimerase
MEKILITGGSGFIGTHLVQTLAELGFEILNLDLHEPRLTDHRQFWKRIDMRDAIGLSDAFIAFKPDTVIHLAARTDLRGETLADYDANTVGVENLLNAIEQSGTVNKAIFTSSMYVCRPGKKPRSDNDYDPHTVYGESKVQTELIIRKRNPDYTYCIIRPTSIWGPYFDEPYKLFFNMILSKRYFHLGKRACKKTYGYVENTVYQVQQLLAAPDAVIDKKVFYLGDYQPYDITEWANEIGNAVNIKIPTVPFIMFRMAAYFGDVMKKLGVSFPMTSFRLSNMTTDNVYDLSPIQKIAPNLPVGRIEGTGKTINWMKNKSTATRPIPSTLSI